MIIHANDTVICVYYASTLLKDLPELLVRKLRTAPDNYLPIHEMCAAQGPAQCHSLPFLHSLSGRDTTSYSCFTGKKVWLNCSETTDISALENFATEDQDHITLEFKVSEQVNAAEADTTNRICFSSAFDTCGFCDYDR